MSDAQHLFEEKYITANQIMQDLGASRSSFLAARRRGMFPNPIVLNEGRLYIWEKEKIQAHIDAWRIALARRKNTLLKAA